MNVSRRRTGRRPGHRAGAFRRDDSGSIPMAMLVVLLGTSLSALLVPIIVMQLTATRSDAQQLTALQAAQTGLDVALGHIRNATDDDGNGLLGKLPCGPISGALGAGSDARYQVRIDYLSADPKGQNDQWITDNRVTCMAGGGTFTAPRYALLRSHGTDRAAGPITDAPGRSLRATYTLQTKNDNIAGGLIHVYKQSTSRDLCLDAGTTSPPAGTRVRIQPCDSNSDEQKFSYNANLNLQLVHSKTSSLPGGMCLDSDVATWGGSLPSSVYVVFKPCAATTAPRQQWSFNDAANFEGTYDGNSTNRICFNVQTSNTPGSYIQLRNACGANQSITQSFSPDVAVGAGAAGPGSDQIVNYKQFGRCIDVTGQAIGSSHMIVWPCKQSPNASNIAWNQKFQLPQVPEGSTSATGRISTRPGSTYCMRSPGSTAAGKYVTFVICPSGSLPKELQWTRYEMNESYANSYRIVDGYGHCLSPTDPSADPPDLFNSGDKVSKLVVARCDSSTLQKWNAPADIEQSTPLRDVLEY